MKRRTIYIFVAIAVACLMLGILAGISINSYTYDALNGFVTSGDAVHSANKWPIWKVILLEYHRKRRGKLIP
ncbi:MAG: hypothetical protein MJZ57_05875 [Bacteroidales bacterium]|nr:hypothetical protein [Bacteroidales bacterium]